ncbi:MAG: SDR family NAD(P)-dependent oxidoreductase [Arenibacterium sp.]
MATFRIADKLAVITGAGSGIGAALTGALAHRGAHLALLDVDAAGLEATRQALKSNVRVSLHQLDVRDKDAVAGLPDAIATAHGTAADILVNNAGVALEGEFADVPEADFDWVLDINLNAPIRLTRAFLPGLVTRPDGMIVNVSSVFGLVGPPGQAAYSTAKFGLRGFTEVLRNELEQTRVRVVQVHPGGVNTNIARNARVTSDVTPEERAEQVESFQAFLKMPPQDAAEIIAKGMERGRNRILVGGDARAIDIVQRLMPTRYWTLLSKWFSD